MATICQTTTTSYSPWVKLKWVKSMLISLSTCIHSISLLPKREYLSSSWSLGRKSLKVSALQYMVEVWSNLGSYFPFLEGSLYKTNHLKSVVIRMCYLWASLAQGKVCYLNKSLSLQIGLFSLTASVQLLLVYQWVTLNKEAIGWSKPGPWC